MNIKMTEDGIRTMFEYYPDGQLATNCTNDHEENFYWDGLALIKRNDVNYTVEPAVTGGNAIIASTQSHNDAKILFNDMLGSSLGAVENGKFSEIDRTSFGQTDNCPLITDDFFTGKPAVPELGYTFLFRNYRPDLGKWQTADPLGYPDGWNNFAYCNNWVTSCFDIIATEVYHLIASDAVSGVGHSAAIYETDGKYQVIDSAGSSDIERWKGNQEEFSSFRDAYNFLQDSRPESEPFDHVQMWDMNDRETQTAYDTSFRAAQEPYDPVSNNCYDVIGKGVSEAGWYSSTFTNIPNLAFIDNMIPAIPIPTPWGTFWWYRTGTAEYIDKNELYILCE